MEPSLHTLNKDMEVMKTDMAKIGVLVERLDITIEKLTEVSANVSQLLAVQASKLEFQDKVQASLQEMVEKRRVETNQSIHEVHTKINNLETKIHSEIEDSEETIISKINSLDKTIKDHIDKQDKRISRIEKWFWLAFGGGGVLLFLLDKINLTGLF